MWQRLIVGLPLLLASSLGVGDAAAKEYCDRGFCIKVVERNQSVQFLAINKSKHTPRSTKLKLELNNMTLDRETSLRFFVPPNTTKELFVLNARPNKRFTYRFWYWWNYGDVTAKHDNSARYLLPVPAGKRVKITQGCNGRFSHKGERRFATDINLKVGSAVHAARNGTVISVKKDSDKGGRTREFAEHANYILIQHDDHTLAAYMHLKRNGARVNPGERVISGQHIGDSGNTGWSTQPHLHFEVFKPNADMKWRSIKVTFLAHNGEISCPENRLLRAARP